VPRGGSTRRLRAIAQQLIAPDKLKQLPQRVSRRRSGSGLTGSQQLSPDKAVTFEIEGKDREESALPAKLRIDTPIEIDYYRHGRILLLCLGNYCRNVDFGGHRPPLQQSVVIQPVFLDQEQAIDYAKGRACFGSGEIRILD